MRELRASGALTLIAGASIVAVIVGIALVGMGRTKFEKEHAIRMATENAERTADMKTMGLYLVSGHVRELADASGFVVVPCRAADDGQNRPEHLEALGFAFWNFHDGERVQVM